MVTDEEAYTYDADGHLINTAYLDGTQSSANYDCCHELSSTDRTGVTTTYGYDALNRVVSTVRDGITTSNVLDAAGNIVQSDQIGTDGSVIVTSQSGYDTSGQLAWSEDALGNVTTYTNYLNANGELVKSSSILGVIRTETYAADGSLPAVTGNEQPQTENVYGITSNAGQVQEYVQSIKLDTNGSPTGEWTETFQDGAGRTTTVKYPDGATANTTYNAQGQIESQTDPDSVTTLYAYNPLGQMEYQAVDVNQNGTIDLGGPDRVVQVENDVNTFDGHTVNRTQTYTYPTDSSTTPTLLSMTATAVDAQKSWNYAGQGTNETDVTLLGGGASQTVQTAADGTVTTTTFQAGRVTSTTVADAAGTSEQQTDAYDAQNRLWQVTDARNGTTTYTYDNAGHVTSVTTPAPGDGTAAQTTTSVYDEFGHVIYQELPDGSWQTNAYYPDGALEMTTGSQTYPVAYTYDYAGRIQTMTTWGAAGAEVTTWNYNERGLLQSKEYADGHGPSYTYTPGGRVATRTDARGITTTYGYNAAGDLQSVTYSDSTPALSFTYNRLGLVSTVNGAVSSALTYNNYGQMTEEDLSSTNYSSQVQYTYDGLNRLQSISNPGISSSSTIGYTGGRITSITSGQIQAQYGYITNSPLLAGVIITGPNGVISASSRQYDYLNRLQGIQTSPSGFGVSYAYNALNQRTTRMNADGSQWNYGYDFLGQVTNAQKVLSGGQLAAGQQFA